MDRARPLAYKIRVEATQLKAQIEAGLPGARVKVHAITDSGDQFAAEVVSEAFIGLSRVKQQQLVYRAVADLLKGDPPPLHALKLTTLAPPAGEAEAGGA